MPEKANRDSRPAHERAARSAGLIGLAWGAAVLAGCQTFVPVTGTPEPGQYVRASLTPEGAVRHAQTTGLARDAVEGVWIAAEDGVVQVEVPILGLVPELQRNPKVADTLQIPRPDIGVIETQKFSALRTAGFIGALAALVAVSIGIAGDGGGDQSDGPSDPVTFAPQFRILRIPFGF